MSDKHDNGDHDASEVHGDDAAFLFAAVRRLVAMLEKESIDYLAADNGANWKPLVMLLDQLPVVVANGGAAVKAAATAVEKSGALEMKPSGDAGPLDHCRAPWEHDTLTGNCVWPYRSVR